MEHKRQFLEDFALHMEHHGLPRMAGRILAWLLICDPPEQSMPDLVEVLQASKSSVSTMTRHLIQFGMIERVSLPGERRDFYRAMPDYWFRQLEGATREFAGYRRLADRGLALLDGAAPDRRRNLTEMRDVSEFLEREFPALIERWQEERRKQA